MNDHKNTIVAIILSGAVLLIWQYFFGLPQMEKQRQEALQRQQQQTQQQSQPTPTQPTQPTPTQSAPQPSGGAPTPERAPPQGSAPAPADSRSRAAALAAGARVAIDTPSIKGSIALRGARIDDVRLTRYRETVDPNSPAIVLLSPSGTPHPFYAEFGWVGAAGPPLKLPGADTVWRQEGAGALTVGRPITLVYDNGEGLAFRRTISVDDKYLFTVQDEVLAQVRLLVGLVPEGVVGQLDHVRHRVVALAPHLGCA